jgi:hypothetical protein
MEKFQRICFFFTLPAADSRHALDQLGSTQLAREIAA